jgi:lysylphosphatidylglycerol synthetase-like protein (DUF2156 family)
MSTKIIYSEHSPPQVSRGFIGTLYVLIGLTMLFDSIAHLVINPKVFIAMTVITLIISLCGLIMSCLSNSRGTKNKSKVTNVFACMMSAMFLVCSWIIISRTITSVQARVFVYLIIVCQAIPIILTLTCGILILTLTTRDYPDCPKLAMPAKLLVGISSIISAICRAALFTIPFTQKSTAHVSSALVDAILALYYISIACAALIGLGTLLGIVLAFIHRRRAEPSTPCFVTAA